MVEEEGVERYLARLSLSGTGSEGGRGVDERESEEEL
jgi:hypothetical protein